jgi:hypothetical protein
VHNGWTVAQQIAVLLCILLLQLGAFAACALGTRTSAAAARKQLAVAAAARRLSSSSSNSSSSDNDLELAAPLLSSAERDAPAVLLNTSSSTSSAAAPCLQWQDVSYSVVVAGQRRAVLSGVSGCAGTCSSSTSSSSDSSSSSCNGGPGANITALMGVSGSGKLHIVIHTLYILLPQLQYQFRSYNALPLLAVARRSSIFTLCSRLAFDRSEASIVVVQ